MSQKLLFALAATLIFLFPVKPSCAQVTGAAGLVAATGESPKRLATGFAFTEGPAPDQNGNVYFTDQPNNRIWRWSTDGKLTLFKSPAGRANGQCFDRDGNLWSCADEHNELWNILPDGTVAQKIGMYGGKLLNGPNDVWITPGGGIFLTDPYYERPYWKRGPVEQPVQGVYYIAPGTTKLRLVESGMKQPNGIVGTFDGSRLYVSDIGEGLTYVYHIERDGSLTGKTLFCKMGSDGMTIDTRGNVYLTNKGVTIFSRAGKQIGHIDVPEDWTGHVCFGGKDFRTLFITASTSIYAVPMLVSGRP